MSTPRIAIFHNFMDNIGGAEMVGLTLARELKADFYTTNIDQEKIRKMGFNDIRLHSIGKVPINPPFRQQAALFLFRNLNLKKHYDCFIIDGDWAVSAAVHNKPNIWYVHSPIREIWDLYEYTRKNTVPFYFRSAFDLWAWSNRILNKKYVQHVSRIICNSTNTHNRVVSYLNHPAKIIPPPIETKNFFFGQGAYWLSVNRLISHKRIELQIEAFRALPDQKLIIVGSYEQSRHFKQYANFIKRTKPDNVEILSWVDRQKLINLYAHCKGFLTTSQDEDFGMNVVEAMAAGKPVIAPNEGGYRETIQDNETGILINNITANKIVTAIQTINSCISNNPDTFTKACQNQAQKFDSKIFVNTIEEHIHSLL